MANESNRVEERMKRAEAARNALWRAIVREVCSCATDEPIVRQDKEKPYDHQ